MEMDRLGDATTSQHLIANGVGNIVLRMTMPLIPLLGFRLLTNFLSQVSALASGRMGIAA